MVINSIREAVTGILKELNNDGFYVVELGDNKKNLVVPVYHARKSAKDLTQTEKETYPQISILDYLPDFDSDNWSSNYQKRYDGFHDYDEDLKKYKKAYEFSEPRRMLFRFDFTVYVKDTIHKYAVLDTMVRKFGKSGRFIVNKVCLPEGDMGAFVGYSITLTENTRTDGIHEINYEFNCKAFVNCSNLKEVDLVETLKIAGGGSILDIE